MVNEVLCKILAHNLTCPIQEQETLGIVPFVWKDEEDETDNREIIRLHRNSGSCAVFVGRAHLIRAGRLDSRRGALQITCYPRSLCGTCNRH